MMKVGEPGELLRIPLIHLRGDLPSTPSKREPHCRVSPLMGP